METPLPPAPQPVPQPAETHSQERAQTHSQERTRRPNFFVRVGEPLNTWMQIVGILIAAV